MRSDPLLARASVWGPWPSCFTSSRLPGAAGFRRGPLRPVRACRRSSGRPSLPQTAGRCPERACGPGLHALRAPRATPGGSAPAEVLRSGSAKMEQKLAGVTATLVSQPHLFGRGEHFGDLEDGRGRRPCRRSQQAAQQVDEQRRKRRPCGVRPVASRGGSGASPAGKTQRRRKSTSCSGPVPLCRWAKREGDAGAEQRVEHRAVAAGRDIIGAPRGDQFLPFYLRRAPRRGSRDTPAPSRNTV